MKLKKKVFEPIRMPNCSARGAGTRDETENVGRLRTWTRSQHHARYAPSCCLHMPSSHAREAVASI